MDLKEIIYKRKSTRKYKEELVGEDTLQKINEFFVNTKPLYSDIKVRIEIINKENVKCILSWKSEQVIAIFSEEKEGYLENIGFIFQQIDLYLQYLGLGSCWLGMGKLDSSIKGSIKDNLKFVIMLAFGYPKEELYRKMNDFKRLPLSKISDFEDGRLEPAQLAPSSVNSQPWYFVHDNDLIHTYLVKHSLLSKMALGEMNQIDVGIALAHMYVANPETFEYFKLGNINDIKSGKYIGSFKI